MYSYHGADYSYDYSDYDHIRTCDRESDGNDIKGVYDTTGNKQSNGEVGMSSGYGWCVSENALAPIYHHRTCERNFLTWDCNEYQAANYK